MHALVLWGCLFGCGSPATTTEARPRTPVLKIAGAPSLMAELVPALQEIHTNTRGSLAFENTSSSTPQAMRALLDGDVDIVAAGREADRREEEQAQADGWSFRDADVRHVVGVDVIEVRTHEDNPVTSLSYDEIIGIFCQGTVNDWVFVEGPERAAMHVYAPPAPSGIRTQFEDFFCGTHGLHASVTDAPVDRIRGKLTGDVHAIAVVSASVTEGQPMGLRPDPQGPAILPTQSNLVAGAYPLRRDVILFTKGAAAGYARSFLDWVASPAGQEVVDQHNYLPRFLRPDSFDEARPLRELVHFDEGEVQPNPRTRARMKLLVDEIRDRGLERVVLEGFTDDRETDDPETLSTERAQAVQQLLGSQIEGLQFQIVARGDARPLAPNDTAEGRQRNRRVQVYLADDEDQAVVKNSGQED